MERINNRYTRDMKQTAVEWLVEQLENHNGVTRSGFEKCIQQAKQMEKEQIDNAWDRWYQQGCYDPEFEKENNEN